MNDVVNHERTVDEVLGLYRKGGAAQYFGEAITQSEHALQSAWLAEKAGASPAIIGATLLHDVGHLLHGLGEDIANENVDAKHEAVGAAYLLLLDARKLCNLVKRARHAVVAAYCVNDACNHCLNQAAAYQAFLDALAVHERRSLADVLRQA